MQFLKSQAYVRLIPLLYLCCAPGVLWADSAQLDSLRPRPPVSDVPSPLDIARPDRALQNEYLPRHEDTGNFSGKKAIAVAFLNAGAFKPEVPAPAAEESIPETPQTGSTRISALRISGMNSVDVVAEGEVELHRDALTLTADRLTYFETSDKVLAEGNVCLRRDDGRGEMSGPSASLIVGEHVGEFIEPTYSMTRKRVGQETNDGLPRSVSGGGHADLLLLEGENHYRARNATWSTCPGPDPDWYIKTKDLSLDYDREIGTTKDATIVFKDMPFFWLPWAEFPLVGQRHSGFLPPTMESSTKTGFGFQVPYYWNIAPNYDFTFSPRYMSRRGLQLGGEVRYMGAAYTGTVRGEYLPHDRVTGKERSLGSIQHTQMITPWLLGSFDINSVSDNAYFEDLSTRVSMSSKVNLLREGRLAYTGSSWWGLSLLAQSYQTLSPDPDHPVATPYRRLPQILLNVNRPGEFADTIGTSGLDLKLKSEYVRFQHPLENRVNASRMTAYPQVSFPLQWPAFYFTPKIGLHYTRYNFDRDQNQAALGLRESVTRSLPIFTVDSGLTFERNTTLFDRGIVQTLEPRLYYVKTKYSRQDDIPLFDTSRFDFGFAQIFNENIYTGGDRIADANQLTAAVTSRLIDEATGIEQMRVVLGQRYYFADQMVTLSYRDELGKLHETEPPRTTRRTDILAGFSAHLGRSATIDSLLQYNSRDHQTERFTANLRYNPGHTRAFNLGYRYARDILRDVDVSGQWPLWGKWYGVSRLTYSLQDSRFSEIIGGLEYNGGCWVLRMGAHRYITRKDEANNTYFLQLELNDFTSIGPGGNMMNLIKRSVPGYGKINEPSTGLLND
ncbi:MAG: LPS-assembly protein LptD [Azoarcus sp.]|nr:LPS-assembly protein LptD [Azoarcus sp.]